MTDVNLERKIALAESALGIHEIVLQKHFAATDKAILGWPQWKRDYFGIKIIKGVPVSCRQST